jgi:50S ribosomal protein L16 3-hydroxylase
MQWGAIRWPEGLNTQQFLEHYWQKKPLLICQAFADFQPGIDAEDVAGLAMEPDADSRLVQGNHREQNWQLEHGPFDEEDFTQLGETDWTLLVCGLEQWWPAAADLLAAFRFLPDWRIDDLMVSVAGRGGSVGPHTDQYDVFLLQADGRRHWQIATRYDSSLVPDLPLAILAHFQPEQSWTLAPGDMLYLPPGVAHHGVAEDQSCMTWSVGFRAPSASELADRLLSTLVAMGEHSQRYRDTNLTGDQPAILTAQQAQSLRRLLAPYLDDAEQFHRLTARALTVCTDDLPSTTSEPDVLKAFLQGQIPLRRGLRRALIVADNGETAEVISGEYSWLLPSQVARQLLDSPLQTTAGSVDEGQRASLSAEALTPWLNHDESRTMLEQWLNLNLLEPGGDDD